MMYEPDPEAPEELLDPPKNVAHTYGQSVCKLRLLDAHAGGTSVRMLVTHDGKYLIKQITPRYGGTALCMCRRCPPQAFAINPRRDFFLGKRPPPSPHLPPPASGFLLWRCVFAVRISHF